MRKLSFPFVALLGLLTAGAARSAEVPQAALTEIIETSSDRFALPLQPDDSTPFKRCGTCPLVNLQASTTTRYFIGEREVRLEELRKAVLGRATFLLVTYGMPPANTLVRVVAMPDLPVH